MWFLVKINNKWNYAIDCDSFHPNNLFTIRLHILHKVQNSIYIQSNYVHHHDMRFSANFLICTAWCKSHFSSIILPHTSLNDFGGNVFDMFVYDSMLIWNRSIFSEYVRVWPLFLCTCHQISRLICFLELDLFPRTERSHTNIKL